MNKSMVGASVLFCGHNGYFVADITKVGSAYVVRANGPVSGSNIIRENPETAATHHVMDMFGGFWRPDLGVIVVPEKGLKLLPPGVAKFKAQAAFRAARTTKSHRGRKKAA
jgi:hypothetical protein